MTQVYPEFAEELERFGVDTTMACFNCGTCAAICPLIHEVKTYFELINFEAKDGGRQVTLHDPCFYGRYLKLSDVPRSILDKFGIENVSVRNSGTFTSCCGGPAESISPALTKEILQRRYADLQETGKPIVSMCPICLVNLMKIGADVEDLSVLLARYA